MSLVLELGAQIRTASDELPVAAVAAAADRLRVAMDMLTWVRQSSIHSIGVPQLAGALEHSEQAAHALLVARDELTAYLAVIGLAAEAAAADPLRQSAPVAAPPNGAATTAGAAGLPPLRRWWCERVDALTDRTGDHREADTATDSTALMRAVAGARDRTALRTELVRGSAPAGLGLAALAPAALRNLAIELLGRPPAPDDLADLVKVTAEEVRERLPHLPPQVAPVLLGRVCRVPVAVQPGEDRPKDRDPEPPHPADAAIAGAVLVAALLRRLDHKPDELDRYLILPEPADA